MWKFKDLLFWLSGGDHALPVGTEIKQKERRSFKRIALSGPALKIGQEGPFEIKNISYGGLRANIGGYSHKAAINAGAIIDGMVFLDGVPLNLKLFVRQIINDEVGCSFEKLSESDSKILGEFLKIQITGRSIREISASKLKNDREGLALRWFQGEHNTQIFLWQTDKGEKSYQEFYFFDYAIHFDYKTKTIQTGCVKSSIGKSGYGRINPETIVFFKVPSYRAIRFGKKILQSSKMSSETREELINALISEERRLFERYMIEPKKISVTFDIQKPVEASLRVLNLSLDGIAFHLPDNATFSNFPDNFSAVISFEKNRVPVKFSKVYENDQLIGGRISLQSDEDQELLAALIAPGILGQSLEELSPPQEIPFGYPEELSSSLYLGIQNAHVLSLVGNNNDLLLGRIVFGEHMLEYKNNCLKEYFCTTSLVFPGDWEIPPKIKQNSFKPTSKTVNAAVAMLKNSSISNELFSAWKKILK